MGGRIVFGDGVFGEKSDRFSGIGGDRLEGRGSRIVGRGWSFWGDAVSFFGDGGPYRCLGNGGSRIVFGAFLERDASTGWGVF